MSSSLFVNDISELSPLEFQPSQPYDDHSPESLDATVEHEQIYTLSLRSNEHSTVYPILNLNIDGI